MEKNKIYEKGSTRGLGSKIISFIGGRPTLRFRYGLRLSPVASHSAQLCPLDKPSFALSSSLSQTGIKRIWIVINILLCLFLNHCIFISNERMGVRGGDIINPFIVSYFIWIISLVSVLQTVLTVFKISALQLSLKHVW